MLTSPIIRCLKQQTGATIHFITKKAYESVLTANPFIDKIYTINEDLKEVLPALKEEKYDCLIDLHKNLRSNSLALYLGVKRSTFNKLNFPKWLLVNTGINRLPEVHIVDRYLEAVQFLGVKNDDKGLDYFIPETDQINLKDFFINNSDFNAEKPFICFAIGAAHATKRLPKDKIMAVCKAAKIPILLLGGPGEQAIGEEIAQKAGKAILNACGKTNINQSASLIAQSKEVITHDTGMMHIAAAFQKPIISIWGNTIPAFGMYPYYKKGVHVERRVEVKGLSCRPCSKIGYEQCPKGHFKCMKELDINEIVNKLRFDDK